MRLPTLLVVSTLLAASAHARDLDMAFLSGTDRLPRADEAPAAPSPDSRTFNGHWTFTSAGCRYTGSIGAVIKDGRIIVKGGGGKIDADGTLHSVGAGGGMTLTAEGHLDGETGSGTFDRSDGCSGTWVAVRRH